MERGIVRSIQWCDTRDMTADGRTKGSIDRELLLQVMGGKQTFQAWPEETCAMSGRPCIKFWRRLMRAPYIREATR
eukprot:9270591-Pyramimonas_sp.AAC.1